MAHGLKKLFGIILLRGAALSGFAFLTSVFLLISTAWAEAAVTTMGDVINVICNNALPYSDAFQFLAYTAGAIFTVMGIHHLRLHSDSPNNNPLHRALALFGGATCLLVLPAVSGTIVTSMYGTSPNGGGIVCAFPASDGGDGAPAGGTVGLDTMLINFVANIEQPLLSTCSLIAILCGLYMLIRGLMKASKYGFDPKTHSIHSILTHIAFGALLMTIGQNLDMLVVSVFGSGTGAAALASSNVLSWGSAVSSLFPAGGSFQNAVNAALYFVQIIGVIAFIRGWLIMKKVVEGGSGNVTLAQGMTHILGGVLAINIFVFLKIMDTTFGTGLLGGS